MGHSDSSRSFARTGQLIDAEWDIQIPPVDAEWDIQIPPGALRGLGNGSVLRPLGLPGIRPSPDDPPGDGSGPGFA